MTFFMMMMCSYINVRVKSKRGLFTASMSFPSLCLCRTFSREGKILNFLIWEVSMNIELLYSHGLEACYIFICIFTKHLSHLIVSIFVYGYKCQGLICIYHLYNAVPFDILTQCNFGHSWVPILFTFRLHLSIHF